MEQGTRIVEAEILVPKHVVRIGQTPPEHAERASPLLNLDSPLKELSPPTVDPPMSFLQILFDLPLCERDKADKLRGSPWSVHNLVSDPCSGSLSSQIWR
ncbi:hypothetical protein U1Q18_006163 [Sarracenia purpurea var. burkii]